MELDRDGDKETNNKPEKMFTLKKWNLVAMWSWDVECDTCAICRVQVMGKNSFFLWYNFGIEPVFCSLLSTWQIGTMLFRGKQDNISDSDQTAE